MIYTTDDVCPSNLVHWKYWDYLKEKKPDLKVIAFTIANNNNCEDVTQSKEFLNWYQDRIHWVTIGVHGYDHNFPPEQERDNAEELVEKSMKLLSPFLSSNPLYRPPGFQRSIKTIPILQHLGFAGIAFQSCIYWFKENKREYDIVNTHCTFDQFTNPIGQVWRMI